MKQRGKSIIILCGKFYPNIGAPAGCFFPYIKDLSKHNNVTVICQKTSHIEGQMPLENIKLYQVTTFYNNLICSTIDWGLQGKTGTLYKSVGKIVQNVGGIRSLYAFPDQSKWLVKKYVETLREISKLQHIDIIISISYPFSAHLAALYYKINIDKNVKWITYTTDPYAHNDTVQYNHRINRKFKRIWALKKEQEIFDTADYNLSLIHI